MCFFNFPILSIEGLLVQSSIFSRRTSKLYSISIQMSCSSTDAIIQTVEPEFVHEGLLSCCPIPRDAPNIKNPKYESLKAKNQTKKILFVKKKEYDQSSEAQNMIKGEYNYNCVQFTHISIPFSSSSPMKGAYICLTSYYFSPPSHLIFTLTSSKGDKTSKKYEFPGFKGFHWHFLPVDLLDVVLCDITGKGRKEEYFQIQFLVFIREETPEEIIAREAREKLWSDAQVVKPEFVKEGGRGSIPIPRDDPKLVAPSFSMVKCKDDEYSKESEKYDQSSNAQRMLKGKGDVTLSHLSIPFPSPSPMKGAYICVSDYSSPSLLFTFTDCDGKKTFKKYEFTRPEYDYEWHFLPIDLDNVELCEIEGKGRWYEKNSRYFYINSLVFLRGDDIPTSPPLLNPVPIPSSSSKTSTSTLSLPSKPLKEKEEEDSIQMSSSTDAVIQTVQPEFLLEGSEGCCPIPRDAPNIKSTEFPTIKAIDGTKKEGECGYDQSSKVQRMMKGEGNYGQFTHISIPFSSSSPMKGAYICLTSYYFSPPSHLIFTLTSSKGDKTSKKYEFPGFEGNHWYFLPVDLPDVVLCEITGKGRYGECFGIDSLVFIRKETPEEIKSLVKPEFVKEGHRNSIPIPYDDPKLVDPSFSIVKCKDDSLSKESEEYDLSSDAQEMLKGECSVWLSHLSIPFPLPSPMKGAYVCVSKDDSSPSLLFTFTDCDGKKINKKYEFTEPEHIFEWHFLPIDLDNIVLCEIEGKGRWDNKNSRWFCISSLVFLRGHDLPTSPPPLPLPSSAISPYTVPLDSVTLTPTSPSTITPQCIIGSGGFGDVILALLISPYFPTPAVLCAVKFMKNASTNEENVRCVERMKKEFSRQCRLYSKTSLKSCIPRPLHILDFLDGDLKGMFGMAMEFCQGGNVIEFAKSWAVDLDECDPCEDDEEDLVYDPVKIAALCVAIIECVATLCGAKKKLVHRDIKPDNFLVRYNPLKEECQILLGDLGFVEIRDSMSRSSFITVDSSRSSRSSSSSEDRSFVFKTSIVGTLCYNAPESLSNGFYCQRSDVWGVVLTIWSLFNDMKQPFMTHPKITTIEHSKDYKSNLLLALRELTSDKICLPRLTDSEIFCDLETMDGGKYNAVYKVFVEVFDGLLNPDRLKRMTIHQAHSLTRELKHILPRVGEGWECPSIEEYIKRQLEEYGETGTIHSGVSGK
ncbi:hypothetical protein ADUPG1_012329 [Aduncisulcus paluster]|uniref:Protein kinase domain-containing protein n=1 Tax=Aduncisulcus paluster TaxID=2918883 RepID=A0ABQ5JZ43_9EUKA|nr:hypothetical protein ADUPG1_012329 [Aduncisulcus paluster]